MTIKKRRDFNNNEAINLRESNHFIHDKISKKMNSYNNDGITFEEYKVLPKYGEGYINHYCVQDIYITISKYYLNKDLVYSQSYKKNALQINFLLKGEKSIHLIKNKKELFFEARESYMAKINYFDGFVKIFSSKLFEEIKIKLPNSFLINHGFISDNCELKILTDEDLVLPITDEILSILLNLQRKDITGTANKIYLNAKIFELIAIQMESYKNKNKIKTNLDKTLEKLYLIKQVIKSNVSKNFSLQELAEKIAVNSNVLNNEFIRVYGCSVYEFSFLEKMNHAKYMLENTTKMIYLIAEEVGYKNSTHFTVAFKRRFGITPKQCRKG